VSQREALKANFSRVIDVKVPTFNQSELTGLPVAAPLASPPPLTPQSVLEVMVSLVRLLIPSIAQNPPPKPLSP
jgi:hypothetical protein